MIVELKATKRTVRGKAVQKLRTAGRMPGVVYGPKQEPIAVDISERDFAKTLATAGESTVINLSVDGDAHHVLIHEVDYDPVLGAPRHADFYAIVKGQKVQVTVPISFLGEAPAVKELSANLVKALHKLEVEADPMDLPHEFIVDVSGLVALDMRIDAKDIPLPPGVALVTKPDEVVATVIAAVEEKEPEPAPDIAAIELSEDRGKKPGEDGEVGTAPEIAKEPKVEK
jgi:large subunit ribosomal protein L25